MKVLHISTDDNMGAGQCCLRIHNSLLNIGIESKVLVQNNTQHIEEEYEYGHFRSLTNRVVSKVFRMMGLEVTRANKLYALTKKYEGAYSSPVSSLNLLNSKWVKWADIIHLHWVNNYIDYPSFFKAIDKPIVWTLHDENLFYGLAHHHNSIIANHPLEDIYRKVKYEAVHSAKDLSIVFLSQMMYDNFHNEEIIKGRRMTVINNSVNTDIFKPQDKVAMRLKHGIDINRQLFLFISLNIADSNKGLDVLSEVLSEIAPDAEILAVGGNPWKKEWKNVRSVGLVRNSLEMCEYISCADYMAMPSYQEAFSQSPIEAMACGVPVVAFPVSGTSELINEMNGVVCEDFTPEALHTGLQAIMARRFNANSIRQDMVERFSPKAIAEKYINLYTTVLQN